MQFALGWNVAPDPRAIVRLTIMPVFFLSTGLRTEWQAGGVAVFGVIQQPVTGLLWH